MSLKNTSNQKERRTVGVIGAGSFGTAIANLLAENNDVILFARRPEVISAIDETRENKGQVLHERISATGDMSDLCARAKLIFPSVSSANFRQMIRDFSPYLQPDHILIHTTKGFDLNGLDEAELFNPDFSLEPKQIFTMSEVIQQESNVMRIGSLSGPNLARELANMQPTATVIASKFDEVVDLGKLAIRSKRFQPYGSNDIIGVELGGVLKNIMAIGAGGIRGLGYGQNALSVLISRGLSEIIRLGSALGAEKEAFLGLAGVGDLVATCSSELSRNFTVGRRIASGEKLADILATSDEVAEGVRTVSICKKLADHLGLRLPIVQQIYKVLFKEVSAQDGLGILMRLPINESDVAFMD